MGGQIAPARTGGRDVDEAKQRGAELWVACQQLHPAILECACAAAAGRRLAGRDPSPERRVPASLSPAPLGEGAAPGADAGGATVVIAWRRYVFATSATMVTRPEFLRRLFNARDRVSR